MKKTSSVLWILKKIRRRIPAIFLMTLFHVGQALLGVVFALAPLPESGRILLKPA